MQDSFVIFQLTHNMTRNIQVKYNARNAGTDSSGVKGGIDMDIQKNESEKVHKRCRVRKNRAGYERATELSATCVDTTTVKNHLPPVGSRVIVREYYVHTRSHGELKIKEGYQNCSSYADIFGVPKIYTVKEYTRGIENPLDVKNDAVLEFNAPNGVRMEQHIKTLHLTTGCLMLCVVDEKQIQRVK